MVPEEKKDERKWVGVRISKAMMHQVCEIIEGHPELAYSTPNDFIRDATRRRIEVIMEREMVARANITALPDRVESIIEDAVGEGLARDLEKELGKLLDSIDPKRDPDGFMRGVKQILSSTFGPTMAETIASRIIKENSGDNEGGIEV